MFAQPTGESEALKTSICAKNQLKAWEQLLLLRISLQRSIDVANKLPAFTFDSADSEGALPELRSSLSKIESELYDALSSQQSKKRKMAHDLDWEAVYDVQSSLEEKWEATLNKWHSRMHFGSEKSKNRLSVFNINVWQQINESLMDEERQVEKSRSSLLDSERLDIQSFRKDLLIDHSITEENILSYGIQSNSSRMFSESHGGRAKRRQMYDLEVYDDRNFYSLLLKTFISSHSAEDGKLTSMRPDDLAQLKKFKQRKQTVDRKASKGRKIRYVVHNKIQNFMFPIPSVAPNLQQVDSEKLFQSLFQ